MTLWPGEMRRSGGRPRRQGEKVASGQTIARFRIDVDNHSTSVEEKYAKLDALPPAAFVRDDPRQPRSPVVSPAETQRGLSLGRTIRQNPIESSDLQQLAPICNKIQLHSRDGCQANSRRSIDGQDDRSSYPPVESTRRCRVRPRDRTMVHQRRCDELSRQIPVRTQLPRTIHRPIESDNGRSTFGLQSRRIYAWQ